jgi:hypothetical protein
MEHSEHTQHKKRMMFPSIYSQFSFFSRLVVVVVVSPFFSPHISHRPFLHGKEKNTVWEVFETPPIFSERQHRYIAHNWTEQQQQLG